MRLLVCLAAAFAVVASSVHAAPPLEAYGRLPAIDMVSLSPSGERFALVVRVGEERKLVVRRLTDGKIEVATNVGAAKVRNLRWAGDDHLLVFSSATFSNPMIFRGPQEWSALIDIDLHRLKATRVFDKSRVMIDAIFGWYGTAKVDGHWNGFVGGIAFKQLEEASDEPIQANLYRVDLETGAVQLVEKAAAGDTDWVVGAEGKVAARSAYDVRGRKFKLIVGAKDDAPLLTRDVAHKGDRVSLGGRGRSADSLLVFERTDEDLVAREVKLGGASNGEVLLKGDNDVDTLVDRESGLMIGSASGSSLGVKLYDPVLQRRVDGARKAFPGLRAELVSYSRTFERMIFLTEGPSDPGTYWLVDIPKKSALPIGDVRPGITPAEVGPMKTVAYKSADGLEMEGVLTLPAGREAKGLPLVVLPHGGPLVSGDKPGFDWWAQAFASRGYAVLQPNYRGTLGYGEAFRKAAFGEFGGKMQTDLSDGVAALAAQGVIDPKRVCIVGASYGGYAALAGVTVQQGQYRCAVAVAGLSDLARFGGWVAGHNGSDQRASIFWRQLIGASEKQNLADISPARLAERADAPILLVHGLDDTVVPLEQIKLMESALRRAGKPVELVVMKGEDHWLSREATRQAMLASSVAFVEKHNPAH